MAEAGANLTYREPRPGTSGGARPMSQLGQSVDWSERYPTSAFHPKPEVQLDISGCTRARRLQD